MIRSVHPFYILGLLSVLLVLLIWKNSSIQNEIITVQSERASASTMAKRIVDLKKVMRTVNKSQLSQFLNGNLFAGAELTHRIKNKRYIISAKQMNGRQFQSLLNRMLNMSVTVAQFKVQRSDEKHVNLYMEISL